ncbi:MAG: hypothetical protein HY695_30555 [Deltaproteobacteria bacterium]|nr:hypothetical protein [Deltaproteobacteria bacterium]
MEPPNRSKLLFLLTAVMALTAVSACVPPTEVVRRPTLDEARLGQARIEGDLSLRPGEVRAEVVQIDPARRLMQVRTDDGRVRTITYDIDRTRVVYHGWEYSVGNLESGDLIAFLPPPRGSAYVDVIRVQEPVQARAGSAVARTPLPPPRAAVLEGTVERINYDLGAFEIRPRSGRNVTVTIPYNASAADIDNFRRLRTGDYVRLEGEFFNADSFQVLAFLSGPDRAARIR